MSHTPESAIHTQFNLCNHAPLGADIVVLDGKDRPWDPKVDREVFGHIGELRDNLVKLVGSEHPDDKAIVESINYNFRVDDSPHLPDPYWRSGAYKKVANWLAEATDSEWIDVLRWNVDRQREFQRRFNQDLPDLQERAIAGIDSVVEHGLLPRSARALSRLALSRTEFVVLDSFGSAEYLCAGYYYSDEHRRIMGIKNFYSNGKHGFMRRDPKSDPQLDIQRVFTHETDHGIAVEARGGLSFIYPNLLANPDRERPIAPATFFNEALVEHRAQVSEHGEPLVLNPRERTLRNTGSYITGRELTHSIAHCGHQELPLDLLGEAYVEKAYGTKRIARKEVTKRLGRSFVDVPELELGGENIVTVIARNLATLPNAEQDAKICEWTQRIHTATGYVWKDEQPAERSEIIAVTDVVSDSQALPKKLRETDQL